METLYQGMIINMMCFRLQRKWLKLTRILWGRNIIRSFLDTWSTKLLWSKNSLSQKETSVSELSNKVKNVKAGGPYQVSILVLEMLVRRKSRNCVDNRPVKPDHNRRIFFRRMGSYHYCILLLRKKEMLYGEETVGDPN